MKYLDSITKKETNNQDKSSNLEQWEGLSWNKKQIMTITFSLLVVFLCVIWFGVQRIELGDDNKALISNNKQQLMPDNRQNVVDGDNVTGDKNVTEKQEQLFHISINTDGFQVNTDIIEGSTNDDLLRGVVHQVGSSFPSEDRGNVVITGHRWYPGDGKFNKIFEDIDRLKKGDQVVITYKNKQYTYIINQKEIVENSNTKFLEYTANPQLTLYTCHPKFESTEKLVLIANLKSVQDISK